MASAAGCTLTSALPPYGLYTLQASGQAGLDAEHGCCAALPLQLARLSDSVQHQTGPCALEHSSLNCPKGAYVRKSQN